jgi:hypothetical protein
MNRNNGKTFRFVSEKPNLVRANQKSSDDDESGDLLPTTYVTPVAQNITINKTITVKPSMTGITCVYCGEQHKFSPFNVKVDKETVPREFILQLTRKKKYTVSIVSDAKSTNSRFIGINSDIVEKNIYESNHVLFWSDGINVFGDRCLIALLAKNHSLVDHETIKSLSSTIYCPKWWDDMLIAVAIIGPLNETINRAKEYLIVLKDTIRTNEKNPTSVRDYDFPRFTSKLRTLENIKQRENEIKAIAAYEEIEKLKELERIRRQEAEEEKIRKNREANFELDNENQENLTVMERFIKMLNSGRKTQDAKYLASINPDSTLVADLTMKLGEISHLQKGVDFETLKKKYKVWKFYKEQQKLVEAGEVKFKKPKWMPKSESESTDVSTIPELPEIPTDAKKARELLILNKFQQHHYEAKYKEYRKIRAEGVPVSTFVLDPWQKQSIDSIRAGKSCLITGPTSGGKTYVMMDGLNNIINDDSEQNIIVVSPTFHLAYQTYANVKATFPNRLIAIITSELIHIPKNANILIGSAAEILNYLVTKNKKFQVGIFDEIHVASKVYCDDNFVNDRIRARAYARLLSRCEKQAIAASATLESEDDMRKFMSDQMNHCRDANNKITYNDIELIKYHTRAVPLNEYRFDNSSLTPITRNADGIDQSLHIIQPVVDEPVVVDPIIINSANLFKLLVQMRQREMTPSIVFEKSDDFAWSTYSDFVDYLEATESRDYAPYNLMIDHINKIIDSYNTEYTTKMSEVPEEDIVDSSRGKDGGKSNGKRDAALRSVRKLRCKAIEAIIKESITNLYRNVLVFQNEKPECLCTISKDNIPSKKLRLLTRLFGESGSVLIKDPNFIISQAHIDMADTIAIIEEMNPDQAEIIAPLENTKGSHFKFSESSYCMELLKAIRDPGTNEASWKHRKRMISLGEAQNIQPKDIDDITDVILRGLEFGIAIISNSLPFVIQNIVLESLKKKDMGIVFASESMSMGINFPLRSVIIKGYKDNCTINSGKLIQMAGRCGRRGLDTEAHVVYYGIDNAHEAHHRFIAPVSYPDHFYLDNMSDNIGSTISNYEELAIHLGEIYMTRYFSSESDNKIVGKVSQSCTKNGGRVKESKKAIVNDWKKKALHRFGKKEEERADDIHDKKMIEERARIERLAKRSEYINPIISLIANIAGFTEDKATELSTMICNIDDNIIHKDYSFDSFKKSQDVKVLMNMMIELYNHYANSSHQEFLNFIEKIMTILRSCCNKLIKHAK